MSRTIRPIRAGLGDENKGGPRRRIDGGDEVAHLLEVLRYRSQFSSVTVAKGLGEPGSNANPRALDDRFELAQPARA